MSPETTNKQCPACRQMACGSSPTGEWCNACGWMNPCPCAQSRYCFYHMGHTHTWDDRGHCKTPDCPAKQAFQ
jgi:hypothetical protein